MTDSMKKDGMTQELITRLRFHGRYGSENNDEAAIRRKNEREGAATLLETQHRLLEEAREALAPFAKAASIRLCGGSFWTAEKPIQGTDIAFHITFGDLKNADNALKSLDQSLSTPPTK